MFCVEDDGVGQIDMDADMTAENIDNRRWDELEVIFVQIKCFFDSEHYGFAVLKGLIQCSGGISARHMKCSQNALFEYLSEASKLTGPDGNVDKALGIERKRKFIKLLIKLYEASFKKDRMSVPLMITVEKLLQANYLDDAEI